MHAPELLKLFNSTKGFGSRLCLVLSVCTMATGISQAQNTSTLNSNADWIHFPPRPSKNTSAGSPSPSPSNNTGNADSKTLSTPDGSAPIEQAQKPAVKPASVNATANSNNDWVQFPPLPAPKNNAVKPSDKAVSTEPKATTVNPPKDTAKKPTEAASQTAQPSSQAESNNEFKFKKFIFQGNTVYSEKALRQLLAINVPDVKDLKDLQKAAELVALHYQDDGVLARVDLLPQDLTDGVVTITITEGRFAGATMETPESPKLPHDFLVKLVETAQPKDTAVRLPQMDKATLLLKEIPGVDASVRLSTGEVDGETRALVQVKDKKPFDGQISIDNTGSTYTGAYRFSTQYNHYGLLGRADAATVQYMHSQGLDYLRLGYSEPLGYGGARWGLNTDFTKYQVVDSTYDALDLHGPSTGVNAYVSQPLVRDRNLSSDLVLSGDHKKFTNHSSIETTKYQLDSLSASWQTANQDLWLGGGENNASLTVARGLVDYESSGVSTEGYFTKWRLNLNRKQKVDAQHMLLTSYQKQWANRTLDSSEKFNIGGSSAVRAYPAGEASGTQASLLTIELQRDLDWNNQSYKFSAFYDLGDVTKDKSSTSSTNAYKLQGLGLWVGASYPNKWGQSQWRVTWARRIGSNPGASNGNDSDGTYYLNRFWFSASQVF